MPAININQQSFVVRLNVCAFEVAVQKFRPQRRNRACILPRTVHDTFERPFYVEIVIKNFRRELAAEHVPFKAVAVKDYVAAVARNVFLNLRIIVHEGFVESFLLVA